MLTRRGLLLLIIAAPLIAAGTWLPVLEWLAGLYLLLCGGLLVSDWRLGRGVDRYQVAREHDSKLSLGVDNGIHLSVFNRSRLPARFEIRDEAPEAFRISERILKGRSSGLGFWQGTYHVCPLRRGDYVFGNLNLRWEGPFGLIRRQGQIAAAGPVKVYPNLLDIRRYDLLLRQNRLQEMGLRHARLFGEGTEFERLREYLPDDDFRRIDWKATARRRRPITTEYQTERSQNIILAIETGRMMQTPVAQIAKLDYIINAALLLGYVATGKGDKIGMMTFADQVGAFLRPRQGRGQFFRMLEVLYSVEAQPVEPDYGRALTYLALQQRKRSLIVILTDLSAGHSNESLVRHAAALGRRSLPLVVTISDPDVHAAANQRPHDSLSVYQRSAAADLLDQRRLALDTLRRNRVLTLDVPANQLSLAVINRYLELKAKTML